MTIAAETNPVLKVKKLPVDTTISSVMKVIEEKDFPGIRANIKSKEELQEIRSKREAKPLKLDPSFPHRHGGLKEIDLLGFEWKDKLGTLKAGLRKGGMTIAILGGYGRGKTQMATELGREMARLGRTHHFTDAMRIFVRSKSSFSPASKETEHQVMKDYEKPHLLVIDETEERAETPFEDKKLFTMINRRHNDNKHTILISNQSQEEFRDQVGPKIWERIYEAGGIVECNWESFRK